MRMESQTTADDTLEPWLQHHPEGRQLAEVASLLRATMGGGYASPADPADVGAWVGNAAPGNETLQRLCADPVLRRQVASTARLLGQVGPQPATSMGNRRRWAAGALLVAASLTAVALLPRLGPTSPATPPHRAGTITAANVRVLSPVGILPDAPNVEWSNVLGADLYEVEVTGIDGRVLFRDQTTDTALQIPPDVIRTGVRYFLRVRARVSVGRWVASDFHEFLVRP